MAKSKWAEIEAQMEDIKTWYRDGAIDEDVATKLGISLSTLNLYKSKRPEFAEVIALSKAQADDKVISALFQRAIGSTMQIKKGYRVRHVYYDAEGHRCESEDIQVVEETIAVPADVTAQAIWLNNRRPKEWKRNAGKENLDKARFEHEKEKDAKNVW